MRKFTILAVLVITACTPRLAPPETVVPDSYIYATQRQDTTAIPEKWWRIFSDATLDSLVELALRENRDLRIAASRIEEARQARIVSRAPYLPQLSMDVGAQATHRAGSTTENYSAEPTVVWEVSLFGALRNADRAARARIESARWALRAMQLSLAAEVVTTYYTLAGASESLRIARENLRLRTTSAALIDSMYRYGMSDGIARLQAQTLVSTTAADIAQYEQSVDDAWLTLCTLTSQPPSRAELAYFTPTPPELIPAGMPSALLRRRPDIIEAEYGVVAAAASARSARSARFPSISLTAEGGVASSSIRGLTSGQPWAWELIGSLTQPLFGFGRLRAAERAAVERYNQAAATYEQTVIEAFAEVEKALSAISALGTRIAELESLVNASERIARMTWEIYRAGMSDYLNVIDAQRTLYDAQTQLVSAVAQQHMNYASLVKALGGGWQ